MERMFRFGPEKRPCVDPGHGRAGEERTVPRSEAGIGLIPEQRAGSSRLHDAKIETA